ncbi:ABC-F family ATP-binding cassette domain-containing protein [Clostridium sp. AM46-21]|uniref:ABC-F family ATP-binding cassette domain-containing protein n=1 Tax=Clostridium sp. AM46-21 TaxID=2293033 RepID=UPI0026A91E6F
MNLLTMKNIHKAYTDKVLFKGADFSVNTGDKIGVIGINGTGKSSLLKMIAGIDTCDAGLIVRGNNVVVNYLPQSPTFHDDETIYEHVITANSTEENKWSIEGDARALLDKLGFTDTSISVSSLSGGQKKKVALAAALLSSCDILVLDEPTNHLDNDMTEYLEDYLNNYRGALVMVTHDRYFLDRVTNRIVEIDKGYIYNYDANYEGYLMLKAERENIALATERKHQNILRKEIAWIRRGARARSTKQKAHIKRYEALAAEEMMEADKTVNLSSIASRLGNKTIELHNISKSFPGLTHPLIENFSYNFLRNDRIGITGPNGCGKSTLMKLITGKLEPDSGIIEIGETVNIGYFSQENEMLDDNKIVLDYVKETAEYIRTVDGYMSASTLCEEFLFDSTLQHQRIGKLSGGEKRRCICLRSLPARRMF